MQREGFWYSEKEPDLPMPVQGETWVGSTSIWGGQLGVVRNLYKLERKIQPKRRYRGWSDCRICKERLGNSEYEHNGFCWPDGYFHYILEHNVEPSEDFKKIVCLAVQ